MKKILYFYFYKNSKLFLSSKKYKITKIYLFSKTIDFSKISCDYDIIIFGGGKPGLPFATDIIHYVPELYDYIDKCKNTLTLGICYGMELLYHYYYNLPLNVLKTRNVNTYDLYIDQRYKESQLGEYLHNVSFNHQYYCGDISDGVISYITYNDDGDNVLIPSFIKFDKKHYGIQFHIKNAKQLGYFIDTIIECAN